MMLRRTWPALLLALAFASTGCNADATSPSDPATESYAASLQVDLASMTKQSEDLYIKDIVVGTGPAATNVDSVIVLYTGWLTDGTEFDSSGSTERRFRLSQLITGWQLGISGMKVGGKRQLVIGSSYGYGPNGSGKIPPHSTLVFVIELKGVK